MRRDLHLLLVLLPLAGHARAEDGPALLCRGAIAAAESEQHIPDQFLSAIARIESGRPSQATGGLIPWPWTINAQGAGHYFATKPQAMQAVMAYQAMGVRSIDVGCLQVNLQQHPEAFATLDQAFDPATNARFAAHWLRDLFAQTGSWPRAAAAYHSQTHAVGAAYQQQVLAEWAVPDDSRPVARPVASPADHSLPATAPHPTSPAPLTAIPVAVGGPALMGFHPAIAGPASHGPSFVGRDLASYRLMPTRLSARLRPPG